MGKRHGKEMQSKEKHPDECPCWFGKKGEEDGRKKFS